MTTLEELHTIIEELQLIDIGEAANYLGEECEVEEEMACSEKMALVCIGCR